MIMIMVLAFDATRETTRMQTDYIYSQQGRRPATLAVLALNVAALAAAIAHDVPWLYITPVALAGLMALFAVIVNRKSGMSLSGNQLTIFAGRWSQDVPTAHIQSVRVERWSDGTTIELMVAGSSPVTIPGYCFGSSDDLIRVFANRNIAIVDSRPPVAARSHS
jgi:endonuclease YncB( thermonuclease family)